MTNSHPAFDPRRAAHRRPGLDLLRASAIVFVVVYHAGLFGFALPFHVQRFGWIGVDLFFVLSGYLIGGQLLSRLARGNRQMSGADIRRFYWRRALRILPAYVAIVAVYFFLPAALREYERMLYRRAILSSAAACDFGIGPERTHVGFYSCSSHNSCLVYRHSRCARAHESKCAPGIIRLVAAMDLLSDVFTTRRADNWRQPGRN